MYMNNHVYRNTCTCVYIRKYTVHVHVHVLLAGFYTGFFVGGGGKRFRDREIDIKYRGVWGHAQKSFD